MKKFLIGFVVLFVLVIIIGITSEDEPVTKQESPKETQSTPKEEPKKEEPEPVEEKEEPAPTPAPEPEEESENNEIGYEAYLAILQSSYDGVAEVTYDSNSKMFLLKPTDPNFMASLVMISEGKMDKSEWDSVVESIKGLSEEMPGYSISMYNPVNTNNFILTVTGGNVFYDAMNE